MDVTIKCTYWFYHHRFLSKLQAVAAKIASGRSKIYKRSQQNLQAVAVPACNFPHHLHQSVFHPHPDKQAILSGFHPFLFVYFSIYV